MKGLFLSPLLLASVAAYDVISSMLSSFPITVPASFDCRITSLWTPERHPRDYPSDAMFEVPIVVSHGTAYAMFVVDELASTGLQEYAETGVTQDLEMDIIAVYDKTNVIKDVKKGVDMPLRQLITFRLNGLKVDKSRHFVTAVTRLSPSPDWFTGFDAFSTQQDGFWYSDFVIETWALDAGTSTGNTYTNKSTPESPAPQSIHLISKGVFASLSVARWRCELMTPHTDPQVPEQTPVARPPGEPTAIPSVIPPTGSTSDSISRVPSIAPTTITEAMSNKPTRAPSSAPAPITDSISGKPTVQPTEIPSKVPTLSINSKPPTDFPSNELSDASSTPVTEGSGTGAGTDADTETSATHDILESFALAVAAQLVFV